MSRRTSILKALTVELAKIDGTNGYKTNIYAQAFPKLKFWDSVENFPSIYGVCGPESREYLPAGFAWGLLNITLKVYCKENEITAEPNEQLEELIEDIELVINRNQNLLYSATEQTVDIQVLSIVTDEGLLDPYAIGEVTLQVRYQAQTAIE